jgi:chromosomal replication initiator protein
VVDHVTEIPLPGRTFCGASVEGCAAPPRVTLSSFVAGPENRLVASAVNRLLEFDAPRATATVLAIYGASGTGKTHLARGLVRSWQERGRTDGNSTDANSADCAEYLTASDFRHTLVDAIKSDTVGEFRRRLRGCKLLAIDDVDRLPRDEYIQQELRYTIDACAENGAMIVVTSASPLSVTRNLSVDVRSRLAGGLELRLAPPDEAARKRLAHHASAAFGRPLSPAAADRLAAGVTGTAGDVFGALFELNAVLSRPIGNDVRAVEEYLANRAVRRPAMRDILRVVAKYYRIPQKVLNSGSRRQSAVSARAMAVYLARELAGLSYERIGRTLGGRDHTTIMYNYRKIADSLLHDGATRAALDDLEQSLKQTS